MSLRIVKLVFCSNRNREGKKDRTKKHHCQRKSRICVVFLLAFEHFHNLLGFFCCLCGFICVSILFCSVFTLKNDKSLCKQRDFKCLQFLWLAIHSAFSFVYIGNKSAVSAKWIHMKRAYCLSEKMFYQVHWLLKIKTIRRKCWLQLINETCNALPQMSVIPP